MSGGQRQGIAISRAVTWASKVVFMDEPTAALGVVQTRNVLDQIKRVRDQGLSVVLISHNLPEIFEVADRIEVLRLGERVARLRPTRRLDGGRRVRHDRRALLPRGGRAMSTPTAPAEEPGTGLPEERPPTTLQRIAAGSSTQIGLILVALIVVFSLLSFESFFAVANARNIATDAAVLLVLAVGATYVIITAGIDLSVGAVLVFSGVVAAKADERARRREPRRDPRRPRRRRSPPGSPGASSTAS